MFWFDRNHPNALFIDKRCEQHSVADSSSVGGTRQFEIAPDMVADFTDLPFSADSFALVVFDPPHLIRNGPRGWLAKKYGKLDDDWRTELRSGFAECFRVLRPEGVLIFKWNEHDIPVSQVLSLTPEKPLFGNRNGRQNKSHWIVFMKAAASVDGSPKGQDSATGLIAEGDDSAVPEGQTPNHEPHD